MFCNFYNHDLFLAFYLERIKERRHGIAFAEINIYHGANNLDDFTFVHFLVS